MLIVKLLCDASFAACVEVLLRNCMACESWNIITLNVTTAWLFDMGRLAFRPLALTTRRDGTGSSQTVKHAVHYSLHWLTITSDAPGEPRIVSGVPGVDAVKAMLTPTLTYLENRFRLGATLVIAEGDEYAVEHGAYAFSKGMYIMLALRWTVDMATLPGGWRRFGGRRKLGLARFGSPLPGEAERR